MPLAGPPAIRDRAACGWAPRSETGSRLTLSSYAIDAMYTDCESVAPEGLSTRTRNTVMAMHRETGATIPVISSPKSSSVLRPIVALLRAALAVSSRMPPGCCAAAAALCPLGISP